MAELVYVDEQKQQSNEVLRSAVASAYFTKQQVTAMLPESDIDGTIERILAYDCKVLVTDYRLSEHKADVTFNGAELVQEFQRRYDRFPCFVTTAFASDAVVEPIDTNIIFPKSEFLGTDNATAEVQLSDLPFFLRVRKKIDEYEAFVQETEREWKRLALKNSNDELNAHEAEKLLELDRQLEALNGKHVAIEPHLMGNPLKTFEQLTEKAELLIDRIENELEK